MSSAADDRVVLVGRGLEAFNGGDTEQLLALFDPEIEVYVPVELPNGGRFHGHDEYLAWIGRWLEAWENFTVESLRTEPVGERHVVMLARQTGVGKGSGIPVDMNVAYLWEVRDGKVYAQHLYMSWEEAIEVARQREAESAE